MADIKYVGVNTMKTLVFIFLLITIWSNSFGQDGSDIRYFKVNQADSSIIGQYVHFDFFRRSFHGIAIDTITINIDGSPIVFIERRKDNGYENWFSEQYLQALDKIDEQVARISKFRLDGITSNTFQVTMYFDLYDSSNKVVNNRSRQIKYVFNKKDIIEVLAKSEPL